MFVIDRGYAKSRRHFVREFLKLKRWKKERDRADTDAGDKVAGFEVIGSPKSNKVENYPINQNLPTNRIKKTQGRTATNFYTEGGLLQISF